MSAKRLNPSQRPTPDGDGSRTASATASRYAACCRALEAARSALAELPGLVGAASGADLGETMRLLGEISLGTDAAEVAVVAEAVERGEPASGPLPCTAPGWVINTSRRYQSGAGAGRLVTVAMATRAPETRDQFGPAVLEGRVPVLPAAVALSEMRRLVPDLKPAAVPVVWDGFLTLAATGSVRQVRQLREALRTKYGREGLLEKDENEARRHTVLSRGQHAGDGLVDYILRLTSEGAAALEAAVDPFSAPTPIGVQPDPRTSDQRRAEALLTVIGRGVTAGGGVPARPKSELLLQISLTDLIEQTGSAQTVGGLLAGTFISPAAAKRISCDAALRPLILDRHGNPVIVGHSRRLFTPAQVRTLMLRDEHCTFPGCGSPPAWTDAHHLIHWADGGRTDLDNATLLCGFHHHVVHTRRLFGELRYGPGDSVVDVDQSALDRDVPEPGSRVWVHWDVTPGSYDRARAERGRP